MMSAHELHPLTGAEIRAAMEEYYTLCAKNAEIERACDALEEEVAALRARVEGGGGQGGAAAGEQAPFCMPSWSACPVLAWWAVGWCWAGASAGRLLVCMVGCFARCCPTICPVRFKACFLLCAAGAGAGGAPAAGAAGPEASGAHTEAVGAAPGSGGASSASGPHSGAHANGGHGDVMES